MKRQVRLRTAMGTGAALLVLAAGGAWAGRLAPTLFINGKKAASPCARRGRAGSGCPAATRLDIVRA